MFKQKKSIIKLAIIGFMVLAGFRVMNWASEKNADQILSSNPIITKIKEIQKPIAKAKTDYSRKSESKPILKKIPQENTAASKEDPVAEQDTEPYSTEPESFYYIEPAVLEELKFKLQAYSDEEQNRFFIDRKKLIDSGMNKYSLDETAIGLLSGEISMEFIQEQFTPEKIKESGIDIKPEQIALMRNYISKLEGVKDL